MSKAFLVLESGEIFSGKSFGASGCRYGELVFNTSLAGYQEILSDPSYKMQIISMTCPEIGNYGVHADNEESDSIHAQGLIVREYNPYWGKNKSISQLSDFLKKNKTPAIEGIDTRRLTRIIRKGGVKKAMLSTLPNASAEQLLKELLTKPSIDSLDLVAQVSTKRPYIFKQNPLQTKWLDISQAQAEHVGNSQFSLKNSLDVANKARIVVLDYGVKTTILRILAKHAKHVYVLPASSSAKDVLSLKPHGILLSNGPGNPMKTPYAIATVKQLLGKVPIFGICFGHQILSLASGETTYKLRFGHRGGNHPIRNPDGPQKKVEITVQNHGYGVTVPSGSKPYHMNLNDNSLAGYENKASSCFSVQYHPEASPGPHDSRYLFSKFFNALIKFQYPSL